MNRIYFDYAASTPVDPEVRRDMEPYFAEKFGNPGSLHAFGQEAIASVDAAREILLGAIGASPADGFREIIFTGSATEANNYALRGAATAFADSHPGAVPEIIVSAIEHESVLETARDLARHGLAEIKYVPVNREGAVDEKKIKGVLTKNTAIVSVMYGNNEVGTIQPIREIARVVREFKEDAGAPHFPFFHTDVAQAFQFLECNVEDLGIDLMTLSAHKIYGPKGVGALYIKGFGKEKNAVHLRAIISGGGQEFGLRSGTENVPSIVGLAKAVTLAAHAREAECARISALAARFCAGLKTIFPEAEVNGPKGDTAGRGEIGGDEKAGKRLPHILNIYFPGHDAQDLLAKFDLRGLAASSGSACRSRAAEPSYVIEALGHTPARAKSSIRFSFGRPTTPEEIDAARAIVKAALARSPDGKRS